MSKLIIDVSYHNGVINWEKVKASGCAGAILRCGYGDDIASQDDKQWIRNLSECERLGIPIEYICTATQLATDRHRANLTIS